MAGEPAHQPIVARLVLENFRNYASLELPIEPGLTIVHGANAQGKTNLIEAINLVATTRLLRGSREADAIRHGTGRAQAKISLAETGTEVGVQIEAGKRKTGFLNGMALPRASDVIGRVAALCVSLGDMAIIRGEPSDRRLFLDLELVQLFPGYLTTLATYKRALEQRNALLRRAAESCVSPEEFEPWEEAMATSGAEIRRQREALVEGLSGPASETHDAFSGGERLRLEYVRKDLARDAATLRAELAQGRGRDIARGSALSGPHRDDLAIWVQDLDARTFASQGQQRTAMLAIKLAAFHRRASALGQKPLILLDDMLSDLDVRRRAMLTEWVVGQAGQALLTCTEPEAAGSKIRGQATLVKVSGGQVEIGNSAGRHE